MSLSLNPRHEYFTWGRFTWDVTEVWRVVEGREFEIVDSKLLDQGNSLIRVNRNYALSDKIDLARLDVLLGTYMPSAGRPERAYKRDTGLSTWGEVYAIILDGHHKLERAMHEKLPVRLFRATFDETLACQIQGPKPTKVQLKRLGTAVTLGS